MHGQLKWGSSDFYPYYRTTFTSCVRPSKHFPWRAEETCYVS